MEIATDYLSKDNMEQELKYILEFCHSHSFNAKIIFGFDCDIDPFKTYEPILVSITDLSNKVYDSIKTKIVTIGEADFFIYDGNDKFNFLLCHESDIHFESKDINLITEVKNRWERMGLKPRPVVHK